MNLRASIETSLINSWARRGCLAVALWPFSLAFAGLSMLRRAVFAAGWRRSVQLPVPVIVVGNIFIGGTGKTPLAIWLVHALRRAGYTPGVVSRGHGAKGAAPQAVTASSNPALVGDEPVLIAQRAACPVVVGRDRAAAAKALLAAHPAVDVLISDDGLQHYALHRDIEIMLFDGRGVGNGWLLPAGPLREPASRRRDFTVVHAEHAVSGMPANAIPMRLEGATAERLADRAQRLPLTALAEAVEQGGQPPRIVAAAGIGNPARFFAMLRRYGLTVDELPLPDHHDFAENPFALLVADIILVTEKDAVKCRQIATIRDDPRIWVVPVEARIDDMLAQKIVEKLRG